MNFTFNDPIYGTYTTDSLIDYISYVQNIDMLWVFGVLFGVLAIMALFFVAWGRLFHKAGLPWERMFVPCYGTYWQHKAAGCSALYWVGLAASAVLAFEGDIAALVGEEAWLLLQTLILITLFVGYCIHCVKLSRSFGHGVGFGIGLIFLNYLFILILGLGKSEYVGEYK